MGTDFRYVTVRAGESEADFAAPVDVSVRTLMSTLGYSRNYTVVDSAGNRLSLDNSLSHECANGVVLTVVENQVHQEAAQTIGEESARESNGAYPVISTLLLMLAGSAALVAALGLNGAARPPYPYALACGSVLLLLAIILAVFSKGSLRITPIISAPCVAAVAGMLLLPPVQQGEGQLNTMAGFACALLTTLIAKAPREAGSSDAAAWITRSAAGIGTVVATVVFLLQFPTYSVFLTLAAIATLGLKALTSTVLKVPPGAFVDFSEFATSAWGGRSPAVRVIDTVLDHQIDSVTMRAQTRLAAGTIALSIAIPWLCLYAFFVPPNAITRWAVPAMFIFIILALALYPRDTRHRVVRRAPRLAAAALSCELAVYISVALPRVAGVSVGVAVIFIALIMASIALSMTKERVTIAISRIGDFIQSLCIALVLPAAMLSFDIIDLIRVTVA